MNDLDYADTDRVSMSPDSLERTIRNGDRLVTAETGVAVAASGAAVGALTGAMAGPPGALAGAVIGGLVGAMSGAMLGEQREEEIEEEKIHAREDAAYDGGILPRDTQPDPIPSSLLPLVTRR